MKDTELLQMALGLAPPWKVSTAEFNPDEKRLDIRLDFPKGSAFSCPKCGLYGAKAHDTIEKTWRHLNGCSLFHVGKSNFSLPAIR